MAPTPSPGSPELRREPDPLPKAVDDPRQPVAGAVDALAAIRENTAAVAAPAVDADPIPVEPRR